MNQNPILVLSAAVQNKQPAVLATVVEVRGATPAKTGAQIVLLADDNIAGTVGGGKLEAAILADAKICLREATSRLAHYNLTEEGPEAVGTLCGGDVTVFLQSYLPPPRLVVVGGGHIGRPLNIMGEAAGFEIVVVDVAPGSEAIPGLEQVNLTSDSYVVLITTDHVSDEAALRVAMKSPAPYIGMIGSIAKCKTILEHLRSDGFTDQDFRRVFAPIGLDLGGPSPQEIAVAILAEVIACRRKKGIPDRIVKTRRID